MISTQTCSRNTRQLWPVPQARSLTMLTSCPLKRVAAREASRSKQRYLLCGMGHVIHLTGNQHAVPEIQHRKRLCVKKVAYDACAVRLLTRTRCVLPMCGSLADILFIISRYVPETGRVSLPRPTCWVLVRYSRISSTQTSKLRGLRRRRV